MVSNPPVDVQAYGQSIWLDYIHRKALHDGTLENRIKHDGVLGVTSNPSIFQKAIGDSDTYDDTIVNILELEPEDIYERLAIQDIQDATDLFRPVYDRTDGIDGYVSLEVSPYIARSTDETIAEAKRLFETVDRPNVMIKIPATPAGLPAIEQSIADGVNVNITLIFSVQNYIQVAEAFIKGLEKRLEKGESVEKIASVASFFLSRIDVMVDQILENNMRAAQVQGDTARIAANRKLLGQAAVANAKLAYRKYQEIFEGKRFEALRSAGAQVQRPLWASTSTKNPAYPDTLYVDTLIGKNTVNTLPPKTLDLFKDHGKVNNTLTRDLEDFLPPNEVMDRLAEVGVDIEQVTTRLQDDGVDAFAESFDKLIEQVAAKRTMLRTGIAERQKIALGIYADSVQEAIKQHDANYTNERIWNKDGSIWKTHAPTIQKIVNRLGWLDTRETIDRDRLQQLQDGIQGADFTHVVVLGMGGSSLAPDVFSQTFGKQEGFPDLLVLDSTDPTRVSQIEEAINLDKTIFIVSSKSGGTIETLSFYKYFYQQTGEKGDQFIAITDDGSQLQALAEEQNFRDVFINPSDIGGRYSALSYFGMVPAALMGLDLDHLWQHADNMMDACDESIPGNNHPALILGTVMGALAKQGRDKVSIYASQSIHTFGDWVEQLIAESIGKEGRGIVPVVGATIGMPHDYVTDRFFVYLRVDDDSDVEEMDAGIKALREAGHPCATLHLPDSYAIAAEFFRWEYTTAIAGEMLKVNPFDEPNVTEAKKATSDLLNHYEEHGSLPSNDPMLEDNGLQLYTDETTVAPLRELCNAHGYDSNSLMQVVAAQIAGTHAGDYFAILAYLTLSDEQNELLRKIQRRLRHVTKRAVTVGFGPRYLHSTGQLHKGGDDNGIFFQLTANVVNDLDIPDANYSFGTLYQAQSAGDLQALYGHDRRAIRLHFGDDIQAGLDTLLKAIEFVEQRRK